VVRVHAMLNPLYSVPISGERRKFHESMLFGLVFLMLLRPLLVQSAVGLTVGLTVGASQKDSTQQ